MTNTALPQIGQSAPHFDLPANGGRRLTSTDYSGKALVLFFYPRDDTSGCTKEAIGFTEALAEFEAAGAQVVGVSRDSVKKHDRFVEKHGLKVTLLSDEDGALCASYGVWIEKSMYGKKYMGIERATFLIDREGILQREWRNVKVPGHVEAVLDAVKSL